MRRLDLQSLAIIRGARIPIIKLQAGPSAGGVVADVSLGDESGPAAARWVTQQIAAYPPLAPLVLVLKVRWGLAKLPHMRPPPCRARQ